MAIDLVPPGEGDVAVAVDAALRAAGVEAGPPVDRYASPWRAAALREGVSREPRGPAARPAGQTEPADDG